MALDDACSEVCTLAGVVALFDYANELLGAYMAINVRQRRDFERPVAFLRSPHGYCQRSSCPTEIPAKLLAGAASLIESVELAWKNMLLSSKKHDALAIFECDGHPWFIRRHLRTPFFLARNSAGAWRVMRR